MTALQGTTRTAVYGATTLVVGAALFDAIVISRAIGLTPLDVASARARARGIGLVAASVLLVAYLTRLYLQVIDSFLVAVPSSEMLRQLFFLTRDWGHGMLAQIVISALVLCLLLYARGARSAAHRRDCGHGTDGGIVGSAHGTCCRACGQHRRRGAGDTCICRRRLARHVVGAVADRPAGAINGEPGVHRSRLFARRVTCAGLLGFAGAATYFLHVGGLDQLLTTPYGLVLVTKIAVFLSAAGVGYLNWKHLTPRLTEGGQRSRFTQAAALEISLAVVAILLTAVLTNLPQPGE